MRNKAIILKIQAIYYFATGLWPLVHLQSFLLVTGEKTDLWLVYMVALLTLGISISLYFSQQLYLLAFSTAISFALIDVIFVVIQVISPIYAVDFVAQLIFLILLLLPPRKRKFRIH